jgi:Bacterial Ig-like domain
MLSRGLGIVAASHDPESRVAGAGSPDLTLTGDTLLNLSRNTTIGNLTIEGSAELIFGNSSWSATLTIDGNIVIADNGSLLLWDCWADLVGTYPGERNVVLSDHAHAELDDALLASGGLMWYGTLDEESNLTVVSSDLGSWAVLKFNDNSTLFANNSNVDADVMPSDLASVTEFGSAGSHLWFEFAGGAAGTYSFPAPNVETTWAFPTTGSTGFAYQYRLVNDWPSLCAVSLYPGSNITVVNSSEIDASMLPEDTSLNVSGLRFGPIANYTLSSSEFRLQLRNVSIESWSFYPVNATLTAVDSQLGEVQGWSGSTMVLEGSNLTDLGGFYAAWDSSTLQIDNCTIGSNVVAYDESSVRIENSSVLPEGSALAVDDGSIDVFNVTLQAGASYSAQQAGRISIYEPLEVDVRSGGQPTVDALVTLRSANGAGAAIVESTGAWGSAEFLPLTDRIDSNGSMPAVPYDLTAASGDEGAETQLAIAGPELWVANLTQLLVSTSPETGSRNVTAAANVSIDFGLPMNQTATGAAVSVAPADSVLLLWNPAGTVLTIEPAEEWPAGAVVVVTIGIAAETVEGLALPSALVLTFAVASSGSTRALPAIVATTPAAGGIQIGLSSSVVVQFNTSMDPTTTEAAFSIEPTIPTASLQVNTTILVWSGASPFAPGTTYLVTIAASATSTAGASLGQPTSFSFTTIAAALVPIVTAWFPTNGSVGPVPPTEVEIAWSVPMDPTSTEAAFAITPSVLGLVSVDGATLTWSPATPLSSNVTYTISVGPTAHSAAGVPVRGTEWSDFRLTSLLGGGPVGATSSRAAEPWWFLSSEIAAAALAAVAAFGVGYWTRGRRGGPAGAEPAGRS